MPRAVLDTNVLVAGLRSARGASFKVLSLVGMGSFEIALSVALVLEYEDVLLRQLGHMPLDEGKIAQFLDYLCEVAHRQTVFYLWRPVLKDPADDMVLELAVASRAEVLVTCNQRHFAGCEAFGVRIATPRAFLAEIGETS